MDGRERVFHADLALRCNSVDVVIEFRSARVPHMHFKNLRAMGFGLPIVYVVSSDFRYDQELEQEYEFRIVQWSGDESAAAVVSAAKELASAISATS